MTWITYAVSLVLFYTVHSLLASENIKSFFRKSIGLKDQGYRLFFNAISLITSALVIWQYLQSANAFLFEPMPIVGWTLILLGLGLLFKSILGYGLLPFFGLEKEEPNDTLVIDGVNSYARHPLYVGILIGLIGLLVLLPTINSLITLIITYLYVLIGIRLEEKKLVQQYGQPYIDYQQSVGMLWPRRK